MRPVQTQIRSICFLQTYLYSRSCRTFTSSTRVVQDTDNRDSHEHQKKERDPNVSWWQTLAANSDNVNKTIISKLGKHNSFVKDHIVGRKLVKAILRNRINPKAPILDIQAGPGIVCSEFLREDVNQVIALEKRNIFKPHLTAVENQYGTERFKYFKWNMLNFFYKFNDLVKDENQSTYRKSESSVYNILSKSPYKKKDTPYSVFSTGGREENKNVIFYITRNLPHEDQILSTGRVEYFLMVHPKFKACIESMLPLDQPSQYSRQFSYFHTFIALLYDMKFIEEFHVTEFVPSFLRTTGVNGQISDVRYLMRMQIKKDISKLLPFEHHHGFSIFLRHVFHRRRARIIPAMELLVNGCGIRMLADGFTMMDTVVNISPERLLQLYKTMLMWPEYSGSHLRSHIEMKTQGGIVEPVDNLETHG